MKKLFVLTIGLLSCISPLAASNADNFRQNDPIGWMMAVIAMGVVFVALVILFLSFKYLYPACTAIGLRIKKGFHRKKQLEQITDRRSNRPIVTKVTDAQTGVQINDEELAAAIGVALFLHEDGMHDQESGVLTLLPSQSTWTGAGQNQKRSPQRRF